MKNLFLKLILTFLTISLVTSCDSDDATIIIQTPSVS